MRANQKWFQSSVNIEILKHWNIEISVELAFVQGQVGCSGGLAFSIQISFEQFWLKFSLSSGGVKFSSRNPNFKQSSFLVTISFQILIFSFWWISGVSWVTFPIEILFKQQRNLSRFRVKISFLETLFLIIFYYFIWKPYFYIFLWKQFRQWHQELSEIEWYLS